MNKTRTIAIPILLLLILLVLAGCAGSQTSGDKTAVSPALAGPKGDKGDPGPAGPQGKDGLPGKDYVAPPGNGLTMKITNVEMPESQQPVVTVSISDENGVAISPDTLEGYGFTIVQIEEDSATKQTRYQSMLVREVEGKPFKYAGETMQPVMAKATQVFADSGGEWAEQGEGIYTYTFKNTLNQAADPNRVTTVGLYAYKNNRQAVINETYSFVQGGTNLIVERQVVSNSACDLCHQPLSAHGGTRTAVPLCVSCHTDQTIDPETGNSLEFNVLIHRLHFGKQLPSVQAGEPYYIVGYRQNLFDFSYGVWPQDTRYCITCHTGGAQSSNFKTNPNTKACTSCHDATNLDTGENHAGGKQTDAKCANCHAPEGIEFDASVTGAHTIPARSNAVVGISIEIVSVEGVETKSAPVVTYKLTNKAGEPLDISTLSSLSVTTAGPTNDYQERWTESIFSSNNPAAVRPEQASDGVYQYQLKRGLGEDAAGTYAFAMEGYVMETVVADKNPVRVAAHNPVVYAAIGGGDPAVRREVVDQTSCNVCHMSIEAHGSNRNNVEYCVMCHNPNATDIARRPVEEMPPVTINFSVLIHRVHRGSQASQPLKVYGFGNTLFDFSKVVFPREINDCQTCHIPGTYGLPLAKAVQPTVISQDGEVLSTTLPVQSLCLSCHDTQETQAHAELQTSASGIESCNVCHGAGREFDVSKAHR